MLEITPPRRPRRFELGIDNPEEGASPAPGRQRLSNESCTSDKFKSPSFGAALRNARASTSRRFAPYAHPELLPASPGTALATTMSEMELADFIMFGGPISSRTRAASTWAVSGSVSPGERTKREGRRAARHLRAIAKAEEYSASPDVS